VCFPFSNFLYTNTRHGSYTWSQSYFFQLQYNKHTDISEQCGFSPGITICHRHGVASLPELPYAIDTVWHLFRNYHMPQTVWHLSWNYRMPQTVWHLSRNYHMPQPQCGISSGITIWHSHSAASLPELPYDTATVRHLSRNYHMTQPQCGISPGITICHIRSVHFALNYRVIQIDTYSVAALLELPCDVPLTSDIKSSFYSSPNWNWGSAIETLVMLYCRPLLIRHFTKYKTNALCGYHVRPSVICYQQRNRLSDFQSIRQ
jgi:hypothetical protein